MLIKKWGTPSNYTVDGTGDLNINCFHFVFKHRKRRGKVMIEMSTRVSKTIRRGLKNVTNPFQTNINAQNFHVNAWEKLFLVKKLISEVFLFSTKCWMLLSGWISIKETSRQNTIMKSRISETLSVSLHSYTWIFSQPS